MVRVSLFAKLNQATPFAKAGNIWVKYLKTKQAITVTINIIQIPAFNDNYLWMFHRQGSINAYIIDPGDAEVVNNALIENGLKLAGILITHHHWDHTNGVEALSEQHQAPVLGPESDQIKATRELLIDQQRVELKDRIVTTALAVPGHTLDHIAYIIDEPQQAPILFCGDTLFSAGCGRMFEGTAEQMHQSLSSLRALKPETQVYCAHEYTEANLAFAAKVEPNNTVIETHRNEVKALRQQGISSIPSTIAVEQLINPFLRCDHPDVIQAATQHGGIQRPNPVQVFAELRRWKDNF